MSVARTERLLNLLTLLLNARRPVSLRELREMEEFDAYGGDDPKSGERAFERDKAALIELGVPLRWVSPEDEEDEGAGGYVVDRERYYLPELALEPSELAALSIAGAAAAALEAFPGRAAVIRALAKLGFDNDEVTRAPYLAHAPLQPGLDSTRLAAHLECLHDAVARQARVHLVYKSARQLESKRDVDPFGLYYRHGAWYLVGYCHLRQAERTFHLGRVITVRLVGRGGDFELPADFDLSTHVHRRPWELREEPPVEVVIRVAARLVPAIAEIFGPRATVAVVPDGGRLVRLQSTNKAALIAAVLPFGAAAEIVSPPSLRSELSAIYGVLAKRYGQEPAAREGRA
jgi:predicted DNA-binding transcriptional regulator YafY